MLDVKARKGADVAQDHHLVLAKVKLKLKKNWADVERRKSRYNVNFLKDTAIKDQYGIVLSNKFEVLREILKEEEMPVNKHWYQVKKVVNATCEEVLGRKKTQQKDWISAESNRKIDERKQKKASVNNSRTRNEREGNAKMSNKKLC